MPHSTAAYPFEHKIWRFAAGLLADEQGYLLVPTNGGRSWEILMRRLPNSKDYRERSRAARGSEPSYLFYDPVDDGAEYQYVAWRGIPREVMERMLGEPFEESDFRPDATPHSDEKILDDFPEEWQVMF